MKNQKPENKRVRKFLKRLLLFGAILAIIAGGYIYFDDSNVEINPAQEQVDELRSETVNKIDSQLTTIDAELKALADRQDELTSSEKARMKFLIDIKEELIVERDKIDNHGVNAEIKQIRINVDRVIKDYQEQS